MILGKKSEIFGVELLVRLEKKLPWNDGGIPIAVPKLPEGHVVICGLDMRIYETLHVCENLPAMESMYKHYATGQALDIHWYHGPDPGYIVAGTIGKLKKRA